MAFRISGFGAEQREKKEMVSAYEASRRTVAPRKSLVQVRFPGKGMALTYFNDLFDLKIGDRVYVDGKLEGQIGLVTEISYNFKIKISDYHKVIAVVDTDVHGQFHMAGSHFITFDPTTLPAEQVSMWFKAPAKQDEEIISSTDDFSFLLDDLKGIKITAPIAERGHDYYLENRVRYLYLNGANRVVCLVPPGRYTPYIQSSLGTSQDRSCSAVYYRTSYVDWMPFGCKWHCPSDSLVARCYRVWNFKVCI